MSIENANVTIYQNDKVYTAITDANGFAIFPDMRIGTAAVNVKLKDHAEVDYVADLTPADNLINLSQGQMVNTVRYASTMVPMFPIAAPGAATITGKVTAELDLTNTAPEPAPNVTVTAKVDVDDPDFVSRYITPTQGTTNSNAGRIIKFAFQDATISTQTDAQGNYTLQVPAALNGLPIKLSVADYQTNQKLYLENDPADGSFKPSEYTLPVLFTSTIESSAIPDVKPVYIDLEAPTAPIGIVYSQAVAKPIVDANGTITNIDIIKKGKYSSKPAVYCRQFGSNAILDAEYNSTTGELEGVKIISGGENYTTNSLIMIVLVDKKIKSTIELGIDSNGFIYTSTITNKGYGYISNPSYKIYSPSSKCVSPKLEITTDWYSLNLKTSRIIVEGSNFTNVRNFPTNTIKTNTKYSIISLSSQNNNFNFYLGTGVR